MTMRTYFLAFACLSLLACAQHKPRTTFLINGQTRSPILTIAAPHGSAQCQNTELRFTIGSGNRIDVETCAQGRCAKSDLATLKFFDRAARVDPANVRLGAGNASEGPVEPVEGPDGLLWLCREDEEAQECICIPWFQE